MNELTSTFIIPRAQWPRVFLIAVALPVTLTFANHLMQGAPTTQRSTGVLVAILSVYILEMAVIAVAAGAGIRQVWLAWTLFAWLLLMVNLQLIVAASMQGHWWMVQPGMAPAAFVVAEVGFLLVWATMGYARWYWRLATALPIAAAIFGVWHSLGSSLGYGLWNSILLIQLASVAILAAVMRLAGFRLHSLDAMGNDGKYLQFGLRHILILTSVLAVVLGVARAAEMLTWPYWREMMESVRLWRIMIACPAAVLIVLAIWAALGKGPAWLRIALIVVGCLSLGLAMGIWAAHTADSGRLTRGGWNAGSWQQNRFMRLRYWWIAWYCLSTGLLSACLLFFRMRGYRLSRLRNR